MSVALQQHVACCTDGRGLSTVRLRRLFTLLMQDLFSDTSELDDYRDELACLKYDTDAPEAGNLYIGPTFTAESGQKDPTQAIFVSIKEMRLVKKTLGNRYGVSEDRSKVVFGKEARVHIRLRMKHPDIDVALMMGESALTHLEGLRPLFVKYIPGLLDYNVREMGEPTQDRQKPEERFRVDLDVVVDYQMLIEVAEESHKLKKFGFAASAV